MPVVANPIQANTDGRLRPPTRSGEPLAELVRQNNPDPNKVYHIRYISSRGEFGQKTASMPASYVLGGLEVPSGAAQPGGAVEKTWAPDMCFSSAMSSSIWEMQALKALIMPGSKRRPDCSRM